MFEQVSGGTTSACTHTTNTHTHFFKTDHDFQRMYAVFGDFNENALDRWTDGWTNGPMDGNSLL